MIDGLCRGTVLQGALPPPMGGRIATAMSRDVGYG